MNGLALCAGVGGLERGIESIIPRARTVCYVEGETYSASVLASKMEAGSISKAPIWSNVLTFDGNPWRGKISFLSGGFPCQPYSTAGKQLADKDPRDLWPDFCRIIGEVRPKFIFLENVPNVVYWILPRILEDLSTIGYDCAWCVVGASNVGAPHKRARWFLFAYSNSERFQTERKIYLSKEKKFSWSWDCDWWKVEPGMGRMVDGVAHWVHRMRACGNGVVPQQAAYAYSMLMERCGFMVSKF